MKWYRYRFHANHNDSRPVIFPPPGPYWETGLSGDGSYATVVAYFPKGQERELKSYWPEADEVTVQIEDKIHYSERFQKPDWYEDLDYRQV